MSSADPPWSDPAAADRAWQDTRRLPRGDELSAPQTQVVADRDDYLGQSRSDVGRRIADDQVEMFTTGELAPALREEFQRHASEFIALHDVGTSASLRLLGALAGGGGGRVQRLSIRRQGHGVALAVLQFVEVPLADGSRVRIYSTDLAADASTRTALAQVLLGHSLLGVLLAGELPPHAMTQALMPLRDAVARGPWPNHDLLLMPLGSGTALAAQAAQLAGSAPVEVRVTPRAGKPRTAWGYIAGAWNRLHGGPLGERAVTNELDRAVPPPAVPRSAAPTEHTPLDELPSWRGDLEQPERPLRAPELAHAAAAPRDAPVGPPAKFPSPDMPRLDLRSLAEAPRPGPPRPAAANTPMPVPGNTRWHDYVSRCVAIKGALFGCVFDVPTLAPLAHAGNGPAPERLARQGALMLASMSDASRALGLPATPTEAAITTGGHHLLLRPVPRHPGIALHLVLEGQAHLTLARMQLERVTPPD